MKNLSQDRRYFDRVFNRLHSEYKSEFFPGDNIEAFSMIESNEVFREIRQVQMTFVSKVLWIIPVCIFTECRNICPGQ